MQVHRARGGDPSRGEDRWVGDGNVYRLKGVGEVHEYGLARWFAYVNGQATTGPYATREEAQRAAVAAADARVLQEVTAAQDAFWPQCAMIVGGAVALWLILSIGIAIGSLPSWLDHPEYGLIWCCVLAVGSAWMGQQLLGSGHFSAGFAPQILCIFTVFPVAAYPGHVGLLLTLAAALSGLLALAGVVVLCHQALGRRRRFPTLRG